MPARRIAFILATCLVVVASSAFAGYAAYTWPTRGPDVVEAGEAYRSGPLDRDALQRAVFRDGLRTVIDVGSEPASAAEMSIIAGYGLRYVRFHLPADGTASIERMDSFARIVSEVPRPVLVRCSDGKDKARFASAVFETVAMGRSAEQAWQAASTAFEAFSPSSGDGAAQRARFGEFVMRREAIASNVVAR